jgi:hypothetical protein
VRIAFVAAASAVARACARLGQRRSRRPATVGPSSPSRAALVDAHRLAQLAERRRESLAALSTSASAASSSVRSTLASSRTRDHQNPPSFSRAIAIVGSVVSTLVGAIVLCFGRQRIAARRDDAGRELVEPALLAGLGARERVPLALLVVVEHAAAARR